MSRKIHFVSGFAAAITAVSILAISPGSAVAQSDPLATGSAPIDTTTLSELTDLLAIGVEDPRLYDHYYPDLVRVKFADRFRVRLRDGHPADVAAPAGAPRPTGTIGAEADFADTLAALGEFGIAWHRSFSLTEEEVETLMARARKLSPGRDLPDLNNYFLLHLPEGVMSGTVVRLLRGVPCIQHAVFLPKPTPVPSGADCVPDFTDSTLGLAAGYQSYLGPAPFGIDAHYAWEGFLGDATGITIADVEYDFRSTHADLPGLTVSGDPFVPSGLNGGTTRSHGTAVLGIAGGLDNGFGVTGIAFGADLAFSTQMRLSDGNRINDPADGIMRALSLLDPGDVMICEMQVAGPNRPVNPGTSQAGLVAVSFDRPAYDAILISIASMISVCEAAGNGSENLDAAVYVNNDQDRVPGWDVGDGPFESGSDTGSVIVGAGQPLDANMGTVVGLAPTATSNTGSTVDLQGWGFWATSAGYGDLYDDTGQNFDYTLFSGTSSASPIVASSCAIVQRAFMNKNSRTGTPREIRDILTSTGTPQVGAGTIGPRPNLRAAIESLADPAVLNATAPQVSPTTGTYSDNVLVEINYGDATQNLINTRIHYTFDGTEPTLDDYQAIPDTGSNSVFVGYSLTFSARAFEFDEDLQRWFPGPVTTRTYTIPDAGQVSTPMFVKVNNNSGLPDGLLTAGYHDAPLKFFISATPLDATIKYRRDGDRFSLFWFKAGTSVSVSEIIELGEGEYELVARGFKSGLDNSDMTSNLDVNVVEFGTSSTNNITQLADPIIFPDGGTFASSATFAIFSTVPEVELRYTTDGSDPTPTSMLYLNDPVVLDESATIKARSYRQGFIASNAVTAEFTVVTGAELAAPTITPAGGVFTTSAQVSLTSSNPDTQIRYTTNGSLPTSSSTLYTGPFSLGIGFHTVKAQVFFDGVAPSPVSTASFSVYDPNSVVRTPVIDPDGGNHTGPTSIRLTTTTEGAAIHYTIDDLGDVTQGDPLYNPASPIVLNPSGAPQIIRAKAFKSGLVPSGQAQTAFTIFSVTGAMEAVSFDPPAGSYDNSVRVTLSCPTSSATFYTTDDGSDPNTSPTRNQRNRSTGAFVSPSLSFQFTISQSGVVRASAQRLGFSDSAVTDTEYLFKCGTPTFSPPAGSYTGSVEVTLDTTTNSSSIRYTTDGTLPDAGSDRYTGAFMLEEGLHTVNAIAMRNGFEDSEIATAVFDVEPTPPAPAAPVITSPLTDMTVNAGDEVTLAVTVTGVPDPTYEWTFEGIPLAFFGPEFVLPAATFGDAGTYTVTVRNSEGEASSSALLTVESPPTPFKILSVVREANGDVTITFPTQIDHTYAAEILDLGNPATWVPAGATIAGNGATRSLTVPIEGDPERVLLRATSTPDP